MEYSLLDTVVLNRDLPEHGLKFGDLGTIVEIYEPDALEVEFVTASGRSGALLTLSAVDVRHVADGDLVGVRQFADSGLVIIERSPRSAAVAHFTNRLPGLSPAPKVQFPDVPQRLHPSDAIVTNLSNHTLLQVII